MSAPSDLNLRVRPSSGFEDTLQVVSLQLDYYSLMAQHLAANSDTLPSNSKTHAACDECRMPIAMLKRYTIDHASQAEES